MFIDLPAAFLYDPLQLVGFFGRQTPECTSESGLALLFADPAEPVDEVGGHFQFAGWKRLQFFDDAFERTHIHQGTPG